MGAQPTDRVSSFFAKIGLIEAAAKRELTSKHLPKKKAQERLKMEEAARVAAAEAAAAASEEAQA